jgi:hypothetical protein
MRRARRRFPRGESVWARVWPWLALAAILPPVFAFAFVLFGGWLVLPEPWSWIAAAVAYGLAAFAAVADWVRRRR